ncbi:MAG: DUF1801 domain-containing protein [Dehalococcoidia bacterium]
MSEAISVTDLLARHPPAVREVAQALRALVRRAAPEAHEQTMGGWKNIVYRRHAIFCYIAPLKDSVNLGFYRGIQLPDPQGLLRGAGKGLRHVKVQSLDAMQRDALTALVRQAWELEGGARDSSRWA